MLKTSGILIEPKSIRLLHEGHILKANTFDTAKGCYTIRIINHNGTLYFHKMLNGNVVEVINLSKPPDDGPAGNWPKHPSGCRGKPLNLENHIGGIQYEV